MPEIKGLKELEPAKVVDVKGQICPYPLIETRKGLNQITNGQVLRVITDNPESALETIPRLCDTRGFEYERVEVTTKVWEISIRKPG